MTPISHDLSARTELREHGTLIAAAHRVTQSCGARMLLVGALARDLHVHYLHGFGIDRATRDVDLAIAVSDWPTFERVRSGLTQSGDFVASATAQQRFTHKSRMPMDLIPFQGVESAGREIGWPPDGRPLMDVFGFREAMSTAEVFVLPPDVGTPTVSLPGLVLLKLTAWRERHLSVPRKDAADLATVVSNYVDLGNMDRMFREYGEWAQESGFDTESASARLLGHDIRELLDEVGFARVDALLSDECSHTLPRGLAAEMHPKSPERGRVLLAELRRGLRREP